MALRRALPVSVCKFSNLIVVSQFEFRVSTLCGSSRAMVELELLLPTLRARRLATFSE